MKRKLLYFVVLLALTLSACGAEPTSVETPLPPTPVPATSTPDTCAPENLPEEVSKVHKLMREFDDYSSLASRTPQSQLIELIPDMQRVKRDAEEQPIPACLLQLKRFQLAHMNVVIETLIAFMNSANAEQINQAIVQSRELHRQYDVELAHLLGVTVVAPTADPAGILPATTAEETSEVFVTNPGPSPVNLRTAPQLDAPEAGLLDVQASTPAFGRSADSQWVKVEIPGQAGQVAWAYAPLVQTSIPLEQMTIVE